MYWIYSESSIIKTIVSKNHAINLQVNSQFLNHGNWGHFYSIVTMKTIPGTERIQIIEVVALKDLL